MACPSRRRTIVSAAALLAVGCLAACNERPRALFEEQRDTRANAFPENYKADLLTLMRLYLNDPTGISNAYASDPMMRKVSDHERYVVCIRYSLTASASRAGGNKEGMALFRNGRPDQFTEIGKEQCSQADYKPFPELEKLTR